MIDFNNKTFRVIKSTVNGDITEDTVFEYQQDAAVISATYSGGLVLFGHLLGVVNDEGALDIRFHHVNFLGRIITGISHILPEPTQNGRIRLHENWQLTAGDMAQGESVLEESEED